MKIVLMDARMGDVFVTVFQGIFRVVVHDHISFTRQPPTTGHRPSHKFERVKFRPDHDHNSNRTLPHNLPTAKTPTSKIQSNSAAAYRLPDQKAIVFYYVGSSS